MLYRAYAKVNFTLEIVRKRDDGFHELASLVHTIGLADDLQVEPADDLLTRVEGLEIDREMNLVARAAELLATTLRQKRGAELSLVKRIPAAAGLGGGSSDAATALVGLNALWGARLRLPALTQLAAELGSDIPFFVRGGAALMRGRGEQLEVLPPRIGQWLVLLVPSHHVINKTQRLYAALEPNDFSPGDTTAQAAARLRQGEPFEANELTNGFGRAARAVFPGLSETWQTAERACQRRFFLSGAGPALFALAADRPEARRLAAELKTPNATAHAVRTVKHARASVRFAATRAIGYP